MPRVHSSSFYFSFYLSFFLSFFLSSRLFSDDSTSSFRRQPKFWRLKAFWPQNDDFLLFVTPPVSNAESTQNKAASQYQQYNWN
jgi:hypothetical protein